MTDQDAKELAEAHYKWFESIIHKIYVDAMVHGIKHGQEAKNEGMSSLRQVNDKGG